MSRAGQQLDAAKVLHLFPRTRQGVIPRHLDGRVLGAHDGIINYTIGQRRGLGIGGGEPLYVVALDAEAHAVIVGPKSALATRQISIKEVNWLGDAPFDSVSEHHIDVKVRSTRPPREAVVTPTGPDTGIVTLAISEEGIAPGQACVFYAPDSTRVLGGGWITA